MIILHGDRVEALAVAIAGSFNNFLIAHIEGGEISGTIDEHIRHSVSKLSHIHFVSNHFAKKRLIQLGEIKKYIYHWLSRNRYYELKNFTFVYRGKKKNIIGFILKNIQF